MKSQLYNLLISISLFLLGSLGHWYIMYWQFKFNNWIKSPWPYMISLGCTFLWILASEYGVKAFNGEMWSNRFVFFVTGMTMVYVTALTLGGFVMLYIDEYRAIDEVSSTAATDVA